MTKTKIYTPSAPRFSLQWWLDVLRNGLFIAVITLMIWIYADMEFTDDKDFQATIVLNTGNSADLVMLTPRSVEVAFKLRGTRSTLASFERQLNAMGKRIPYDVSRYGVGKNDIRTEDVLRLSESVNLMRQGLSVLSATPTQVGFELDKRVQQVARVELDSIGATLSSEPTIEPGEVTIRLAESDLTVLRKDLPTGDPIVLKTRRLDLRNAPTGVPYSETVEIVPPPAQYPVEMETKTVRVTVQIDQRTDTRDVRVAVQLRLPYTWTDDGTWDEYLLVKKDQLEWQPQIRVQGARKDLERLRPEDVDAYVTLTDDDKTRVESWLTRAVTVRFPKGMDVQLVGEAPVVNFRMEKRAAAPAPAAP